MTAAKTNSSHRFYLHLSFLLPVKNSSCIFTSPHKPYLLLEFMIYFGFISRFFLLNSPVFFAEVRDQFSWLQRDPQLISIRKWKAQNMKRHLAFRWEWRRKPSDSGRSLTPRSNNLVEREVIISLLLAYRVNECNIQKIFVTFSPRNSLT